MEKDSSKSSTVGSDAEVEGLDDLLAGYTGRFANGRTTANTSGGPFSEGIRADDALARDIIEKAVRGEGNRAKVRERLKLVAVQRIRLECVRTHVEVTSGTIACEVGIDREVVEEKLENGKIEKRYRIVTDWYSQSVTAAGASARRLGVVGWGNLGDFVLDQIWSDELSLGRVIESPALLEDPSTRVFMQRALDNAVQRFVGTLYRKIQKVSYAGVRYNYQLTPIALELLQVDYLYREKAFTGYIEPDTLTYFGKAPDDPSGRIALGLFAVVACGVIALAAGLNNLNSKSPIRQPEERRTASSQPLQPSYPTSSSQREGYSETTTAVSRTVQYLSVVGVADDDVLNVRSLPDASAPIIATLHPHTRNIPLSRVSVGSGQQPWYRVEVNGTSGWVNSRFVKFQNAFLDDAADVAAIEETFETSASTSLPEPTAQLKIALAELSNSTPEREVWETLRADYSPEVFQKLADEGDPRAASILGFAYANRLGVPRDFTKAGRLYEIGCGGDDPVTCNRFAALLLEGKGVLADRAKAMTLFVEACDRGVKDACANVGYFYSMASPERDFGRARAIYETACSDGAMIACNNLGALYENGEGVKVDRDKALRFYDIACRGGEKLGCENLSGLR